MCGRGAFCGGLLGGGLLAASHQGTPPGNMMGHTPYQTWHMYYYFRPYQMSQVTDLENEAVTSPDTLNAWDNRIFERIGDEYGRRFQEGVAWRNDRMTQGLEFVGRSDLTSYNALPQEIHAKELERAVSDSSPEADVNPDLPSPSDLEPHVSEFFDDDSVNIAELQLINPAVPPRRQ